MDWVTATIGSAAACLTTCAFAPQAIKTLGSKDTSGISLTMYLLFVSGTLLWLVYGILLREAPIIAANAVTAVLASSVLALKIRHG